MSQDLGVFIKTLFGEAESARSSKEKTWMKDYLQTKSEYEQDELKKIKRSKMYVPATRVKLNTVLTQVMDFLFPASDERNWDLKPSPRPELHPSVVAHYQQQAAMQGAELSPEELEKLLDKNAKDSCNAMCEEISDQLVGGSGRKSYRSVCKSVAEQKLKYGTGILKGPLVREEFREAYAVTEDGSWKLQKTESTELRPFYEDVSVWNAYPDANATRLGDCEYIFQDHIYNRHQVLDLKEFPGFKEDVIRAYLLDNKDGDLDSYKALKLQQKIGSGETRKMDKRYRVYEFWGTLTGDQLASVGIQIPDEDLSEIFPANVWMLGDKVIKAVINPLEGATIPYQFDYFVEDEDSIWGDGLPKLLRHPQKALNSAMRMLLDNASVSCGPQVAANMSAFTQDEDPRDIYAFKFWPFRSVEDMNKALKFFSVPSYTNELMALVRVFNDMVDDMSVPRFMGGDGSQMRGAGKTARGLSMLIGAAHQILKDLVKSLDENITRPFFKKMYFWNMQFNPRQDIKGDFEVIATGTSVLMAKEVQLERMQTIAAITDNPRFEGWIDDEKLIKEICKNLDLPDGVLRSAREKQSWERERLAETARANVQALVEELENKGVDVQQHLLSMLQQQAGALMPEGGPHEARGHAA
ncbi:portal protein [Maridesulfovibrio sp.]|uniref:portal protein n=1 Tax=Maridesulfovibrio sp. TaxID=2795000 RepID=UPI003AFFCF49